ncbi:MAG: LPS export ABC transporter permease LptF [Nitrospinae bacterium]|nr:LPS export ABC transporter permease LptF [Nitrospinota bacterium]
MVKIFLLSVIVLTAVLFVDKILFLTEIITNKGIEFTKVILLITYVSPAFLVITVPMSLLAATLITFNRLTADSEMDAIKSAGVSFYRLLVPVIAFSVIVCMFNYYLMIIALPEGNKSFQTLIFDIIKKAASMQIKERVFNKNFGDFVLYIDSKSSDGLDIEGVFIYHNPKTGKAKLITAKKGQFIANPKSMKLQLNLKDGQIHNYVEERKAYQHLSFENYLLSLELNIDDGDGKRALKGNRDMSIKELLSKIKVLKKEGKDYNRELVSLNKIFSIPFACLLLGFIGAPLGLHSRRAGKSGGFAVSLIVILVYYLLLISGEGLGDAGKINPSIAMWTPNILIAIVGFYLVYKSATEKPFTMLRKIQEMVEGFFIKIISLFNKKTYSSL